MTEATQFSEPFVWLALCTPSGAELMPRLAVTAADLFKSKIDIKNTSDGEGACIVGFTSPTGGTELFRTWIHTRMLPGYTLSGYGVSVA